MTPVKETFRHEWVNPYAGGGLFGQYKMMQKKLKGLDGFQKLWHPRALDESSLSIGRVTVLCGQTDRDYKLSP